MITTAEKIAVMQAFEDGKRIRRCNLDDELSYFQKPCTEPMWSWNTSTYEVVPEPKTFTVWPVNLTFVSGKGLSVVHHPEDGDQLVPAVKATVNDNGSVTIEIEE